MSPRILVIDPDPTSAQQVAMTLDSAGLEQEWCVLDGRAIADKLKTFQPTLLWVKAELGSDHLGRVLATLDRNTALAGLPIVLLCSDIKDASYVRQLKTGVVELLQAPFSARLHLARLRLLPQELPERSGTLRGKGTGRELTALLEHLIRAHRTGSLIVNEGTSGEGRAFFVKGVLKSAWHGGQQGQASLKSLSVLPQASWQFSEGADGAGGLIEWDPTVGEDEPLTLQGVEESIAPPPSRAPPAIAPVSSGLPPELDAGYAASAPAPAPAAPPAPRAAVPLARIQVGPPPAARAPAAPAAAGPTGAAPTGTAPTPAAAAELSPLADQTPILFVDDDPALSRMFATYFSKKGYPVDTAADGVEAMQKLLQESFEIVIADLNMPRLDGWGLLRFIRDDFRTLETPVALFSAQNDYRESLRAVNAGAQAYYSKSLRMNSLELQVRELLEPRRRFTRLLDSGQSVSLNLSSLGPQWVLRAISRARVTGQLDAFDAWASYRLFFASGQLMHVTARAGQQAMAPEQALPAFLASRGLEGSMSFGGAPVPSAFAGRSTDELLTWAADALNEQKKRAREETQGQARQLDVDGELYQLYAQVGSPQYRQIAQLLCETRLLPRDVMARLNVSPAEVAAVVNDLLLRGVVSFKP